MKKKLLLTFFILTKACLIAFSLLYAGIISFMVYSFYVQGFKTSPPPHEQAIGNFILILCVIFAITALFLIKRNNTRVFISLIGVSCGIYLLFGYIETFIEGSGDIVSFIFGEATGIQLLFVLIFTLLFWIQRRIDTTTKVLK